MFSFQLLTPADGCTSCRASLLCFDHDIKILADPCWNGQNVSDLDFFEDHLRDVNFILLSHSTPDFIGAYVLLCIRFPNLMATIPVYSTLPVNQLGRVSTVELYRANGILGPLNTAMLEIDDVDQSFDKVHTLKYFQSVSLLENRLNITPYNAGHSLGGAFWFITKRLERIIYAPTWNHSKDSFLNGASFLSSSSGSPLSQLMRPTALITYTDLGSDYSHKQRTDKFLALVNDTLSNSGTVLLPTSLSGRFLELLHLIDQHLESSPTPVYFISYSGTKVLAYATSLLEWMASQLVKKWEEASMFSGGSANRNNFPFDHSKVDLLDDLLKLMNLPGPKVVFAAGVDMNAGDISTSVLKFLCEDERTTIILTEKSHFGGVNSLGTRLYSEWFNSATKEGNGKSEEGKPVFINQVIPLANAFVEEPLTGQDLEKFKEHVQNQRGQKYLAKVRDRKNKSLLNADTLSDSSDDDDDEDAGNSTDEEIPLQAVNGSVLTAPPNSMIGTEDFRALEIYDAELIKQTIESNKPLDLIITHKMKPKQAMFPFYPTAHKQKFDDYGEVIDIKDFQKVEDNTNGKLIQESKRRFERRAGQAGGKQDKRDSDGKQQNQLQNKLTPQEVLNNQLLEQFLDPLLNPKRRILLGKDTKYLTQQIKFRCRISYVDMSGVVDNRSLLFITSLLKPYNVLILPDFTSNKAVPQGNDGFKVVKESFDNQTGDEKMASSEFSVNTKALSLSNIRSSLATSGKVGSGSKIAVTGVEPNVLVKIGDDIEDGMFRFNNFELKLDDKIIEDLKWQTIDGDYRVSRVYGMLEIRNPIVAEQPAVKKHKSNGVSKYLNSATEFTLKYIPQEEMERHHESFFNGDDRGSLLTPKLAIGNIRLPELKKRLISKGLKAEFKSEGTLVVNDTIAVRKVSYSGIEGDDTGDIVIDGTGGVLYYQVRNCIKEMLAYVF